MGYLSETQIALLQEDSRTVPERCEKLVREFLARPYGNQQALEYAHHGFSRRLTTLVRCIENTFRILPPDFVGLPSREQLLDAAINVQAFTFNVFGSLDNLAWIWVSERGVTKKDGLPLPPTWVGLGKANMFVRQSFSSDFQEYLRQLDPWFHHLEDFRHALAHRIPLYIPPYVVPKANEAAYRQHQVSVDVALSTRNFTEYDFLSDEQDALSVFRPWVTHSVMGDTTPVMLHAQLLVDFATVEAVAPRVLTELDR